MWETFTDWVSTGISKTWNGIWEIGTKAYEKISAPDASATTATGGGGGSSPGGKKPGMLDAVLNQAKKIPVLGKVVESAQDIVNGTADFLDSGRLAGLGLGGLFGAGVMMLFGFSPFDGIIPFLFTLVAAAVGSVAGPAFAAALSAPSTPGGEKQGPAKSDTPKVNVQKTGPEQPKGKQEGEVQEGEVVEVTGNLSPNAPIIFPKANTKISTPILT